MFQVIDFNYRRTATRLFSNIFVFLLFFFSADLGLSQKKNVDDWCFLSTATIGAKQFLESYPKYDGRGTVIFILDSGVDMGTPGLKTTSNNLQKVIDARDFSGQGDVSLYFGKKGSDNVEKFIEHPDGFRLYNYHLLKNQPVDDEYLIGYLDEKRFKNSRVSDINNNGRYDDLFGILAFEIEQEDTLIWVAYVDTDGDGHLEDESALSDYRVKYDTFQLRGGDKNFDRRYMTFALNIFPYEKKISIHFDDDGHGSHVAGIAAGYEINNQQGFNGIAPGAQIISLKIGNNTYDGGCTITGSIRKALQFAEEYAQQKKIPVVINISYGIGSIREGESEFDFLVNNMMTYNDNIFICTSNGNEGPGISTTGSPAAANLIFSVGAFLPGDIANECFEANLKNDKIFDFSSRGGELNKPDAIAPGGAFSTVPPFSNENFMQGTSMAAPQAAGAAALLFSTTQGSSISEQVSGTVIKNALKYGSSPLNGYNYLDQGNGVINVPHAFQLLKSYSKFSSKCHISYDITTECPINDTEISSSAYWRCSGYFPSKNDKQTFLVNAVFKDSVDADQRANFFRAFSLKATHPWLSPLKKSIFIKGDSPINIDIKYNHKMLTEPGLYCGKIIAYRKSPSALNKSSITEFELLNTIIIPYTFDFKNEYQRAFNNRIIRPGDVDRYFILVPNEATSAKIIISPADNKFCDVNCFGFTPYGYKDFETRSITNKQQNKVVQIISTENLVPGIWEIDIYSDYQNDKKSHYNLNISFNSFKIKPQVITTFNYEMGQEPKGNINVTNQFNNPFYGFGKGEMSGYQKIRQTTVENNDIFTYDFKPGPDVERVEFLFDLDDDSFLKLTDVAINIYNSKGTAVAKDALTLDKGKIELNYFKNDYYTLEIKAAFLYPTVGREWKIKFIEKYYLKEQIKLKVYSGNERLFKLYPLVPKDLQLVLEKSPRIAPDGFKIFGKVEFLDRNLLHKEFIIPIYIETM